MGDGGRDDASVMDAPLVFLRATLLFFLLNDCGSKSVCFEQSVPCILLSFLSSLRLRRRTWIGELAVSSEMMQRETVAVSIHHEKFETPSHRPSIVLAIHIQPASTRLHPLLLAQYSSPPAFLTQPILAGQDPSFPPFMPSFENG